MPELAPTTSATWPVKSYGRVHGCFILAAQILVERPEDRVYDDIAAAGNVLLDELEVGGAQFIEAACNGSVGETADCAALS
jgi:hypothetical protein